MDEAFRSLLACPACGGALCMPLGCTSCGVEYGAPGGIPALRMPGDARTERVRDFYMEAPFPGYPPRDSIGWLRARAERSKFARLLDAAIPGDARIVEIGCGTGQMSLYLARADRVVIGADLCRASLQLATRAARRLNAERTLFIETDLTRPALPPASFDVVYCSGVLHHTPDPRQAFRRVAALAKPGGTIFLGLYNSFARLPLRMRRIAARLTGERWIPGDPVLRDRKAEPARREAWLRDQYRHPEEHRYTLGEVRHWFTENQVNYVRSFPSALVGDEDESALTDPEQGGWWLEDWLAQCGWIRSLSAEGGLFVTVGQRAA